MYYYLSMRADIFDVKSDGFVNAYVRKEAAGDEEQFAVLAMTCYPNMTLQQIINDLTAQDLSRIFSLPINSYNLYDEDPTLHLWGNADLPANGNKAVIVLPDVQNIRFEIAIAPWEQYLVLFSGGTLSGETENAAKAKTAATANIQVGFPGLAKGGRYQRIAYVDDARIMELVN